MAITQIDGGRQIRAGTITDAEIAAGADIQTSKLEDGAEFIQRDGSVDFTGDQSMGGNKLTNVATPVSGTDAANKDYVDGVASGVDWKASVRVATVSNITLSGEQTIDGVAVVAGDRVLVKNQSTGADNGIYVAASGAWSRATDADADAEVTGGLAVFVEEGTVNADTGWVLTNNGTVDVGTDAQTFTQFTGLGQVTAGAGLTKTGNTLDVGAGNGIQVDADSVTVKIDGSTLSKSGSGLKVADNGITETQINTSVAGDGLTGGGGSALAVNAGDGLETNSDAVRVKLDGSSISRSSSGIKVNPAKFIVRETPTGDIDGVNDEYVLAATPITGKEEVYLNGLLQDDGGEDYDITGDTITFTDPPQTGDKIRVSYLVA